MSITVNDHRKYTEAKEAEAAAKKSEDRHNEALLPQAASEFATTGDDHMDKLTRAIQATIDELELQLTELAKKGMCAVPVDMVKMVQMEYMHTHGKIAALKEVVKIPQQIMLESRPAPSPGLHLV